MIHSGDSSCRHNQTRKVIWIFITTTSIDCGIKLRVADVQFRWCNANNRPYLGVSVDVSKTKTPEYAVLTVLAVHAIDFPYKHSTLYHVEIEGIQAGHCGKSRSMEFAQRMEIQSVHECCHFPQDKAIK